MHFVANMMRLALGYVTSLSRDETKYRVIKVDITYKKNTSNKRAPTTFEHSTPC